MSAIPGENEDILKWILSNWMPAFAGMTRSFLIVFPVKACPSEERDGNPEEVGYYEIFILKWRAFNILSVCYLFTGYFYLYHPCVWREF